MIKESRLLALLMETRIWMMTTMVLYLASL